MIFSRIFWWFFLGFFIIFPCIFYAFFPRIFLVIFPLNFWGFFPVFFDDFFSDFLIIFPCIFYAFFPRFFWWFFPLIFEDFFPDFLIILIFFSGFIGPKNGMNDAHYKLLKTFTNHKTFHPGVDSKTNKNFAGKRKISSVFLSQNSFSYHFIFQFFVNPENFGNLCMFKKKAFLHLY